MKKIVIKQSLAGYGSPEQNGEPMFSFVPEQIVEIEDNLASAWVASGIAVWAPKEQKVAPKAEYAVVPKPEPVVVPKEIVKEVPKEG